MKEHTSKPKPALLVIDEATGKRIRQLRFEEPYPGSQAIDLIIEFDDGTQVAIGIDLASRLSFAIEHLAPDSSGDMEPVAKRLKGSIHALVRQQGKRDGEKARPKGAAHEEAETED
jgi:hypothetical protein